MHIYTFQEPTDQRIAEVEANGNYAVEHKAASLLEL